MSHFTGQDRQRWIGLLSRAAGTEIEFFFRALDGIPSFSELRPPEIGMVMLRGRIGGSGAVFNLGEMTVTRCSVCALGHTGHAVVQGRGTVHARFAALADALLQDEAWFSFIYPTLIERFARTEAELSARRTQEANGTKVDFFTMVRGEDDK